MEGEADIIESLRAVGYQGKFLENSALQNALNEGPKSEGLMNLIKWIATEVHVLRGTDEKIAGDADFNEFMLEMSALLKELGCPYTQFVAGPVSGRLQTKETRILLLDYLLTELMACKMYRHLQPEKNDYIIPMCESTTARALETMTKDLNLGKPPGNITAKPLFDKISKTLDNAVKRANIKKLSEPLFKTTRPLSNVQWEKLENLHRELDQEYNLRRQMLITRLEVTIQSFQWSDRMKGKENEIAKNFEQKKKELEPFQIGGNDTDIAALLAARADLAIIEKTSNAIVRKNTHSKIQKHVIGKVPDRGGRAYEHAPPPPEMPSWQQNRSSGPGGRGGAGAGGGGGRGGGSGGRGGGNNPMHQRQQFEQRQQFDQRQQYNQGQQYNQNQQFNQGQQQYNQRQYDNRGGDNQWSGGGGRVQGGWSQRGNESKSNYNQGGGGGGNYDYQSNNYGGGNQGGYGGGGSNNSGDRGGNYHRGRSNYNRGGGRR